MKTIRNIALVVFASLFMLAFTTKKESTVKLSAEDSKIMWTGYKVTGQHEGYINLKEGNLTFDEDKLIGGKIVMDMTSITCTDLEGDSKGKLEGHLKSADFFGVDKYPTALMEIKNVVDRGTPGNYKIVADLTIKETTKEIKFNAEVRGNGEMAKGGAEFSIDRSDYNVKYGSGSFFDNLGDKTIYDEFDMSVMIVSEGR